MSRTIWTAVMILASAVCGFGQQIVYFPQIANGMENGTLTHWHTTIFVGNQTAAVATGSIVLSNSDSTPMQASFVDENGNGAAFNGQIHFQLTPGQSHKYTSTAANPLQIGYGIMTSNVLVAGNAVFSHYSNAGPEFLIAEAAVPATNPLGRGAIFVDTQFGFNAGIAVVNTAGAAQDITFQLVDANGIVIQSTVQTLGPRAHFAKLLTELFPNVPEMAGRLRFIGGAPIAPVALRFDDKLSLFTTLFPFVE